MRGSKKQRRVILSSIVIGSALSISPKNWVKPVINTVLLPAHAQTSNNAAVCIPCTQNVFPAVPQGAQANTGPATPPGPEGSFAITVCIDDSTTMVQMVATDNNPGFGGGGAGLEFDESLTITVNRPDLSSGIESYSSFQAACSAGAIAVPVGSADFDITALFTNGAGEFVCGDHTVTGMQCNANARWAIRSFDIVVS